MKVTFVLPPPNLSGGIRVVAVHAAKLTKRGHKVSVVYPRPEAPSLREVFRALVRGKSLPARPTVDATFFQGSDVRLIERDKAAMENPDSYPDADIVIATWWETAEWVIALPPSKGTKVYFLQGYEAFEYMPVERVERTWTFPMRKVVVARWLADLARERFGDNDVAIVPNSVDTSQFFASPRDKQEVLTLGVVYSDMPVKGVDIALQAFAIVKDHVPGVCLVSFGNTPPSEHLPLPSSIQFECKPAQERLREIYSRCDAWLFPSRQEGFGLPILEAMACRTPVVATPAGAAPELLAKGGGLLVKHEDPKEMAQAILKIHAMSNQEWQELSNQAYDIAHSYTWDDANALFEAALIRAVRQSPQ